LRLQIAQGLTDLLHELMRIVMVEPVGKDQLGQGWGLTVECKVDHGFLYEDGEF
jgi:hypothetical protein